jgi:hypothetical protein
VLAVLLQAVIVKLDGLFDASLSLFHEFAELVGDISGN